MKTQILTYKKTDIDYAVKILHEGGLVAFPTETVYGLGANALNSKAVEKIFQVKGRPVSNPLIVHICRIEQAREFGQISDIGQKLMDIFWPGPLTLVVQLKITNLFPKSVTASNPTVALRMPANLIALNLLSEFEGPLVAPSANISGSVSTTQIQHVLDDFNGKIDAIIDGGACHYGLESTIVSVCDETPRILRLGAITSEIITTALGVDISYSEYPDIISSPGQMNSHYSPRTRVRLNAHRVSGNEVMLGFGPKAEGAHLNLSFTADLNEAARNLFHMLRYLDIYAQKNGFETIAVYPIPKEGIGYTINDRLTRAYAGNAYSVTK